MGRRRANRLALIYGVGADDPDMTKRLPLTKSVTGYDDAGAAGLLERTFAAGDLALPEPFRSLAAASEADPAAARQHALLGLARARLLQPLGQQP